MQVEPEGRRLDPCCMAISAPCLEGLLMQVLCRWTAEGVPDLLRVSGYVLYVG